MKLRYSHTIGHFKAFNEINLTTNLLVSEILIRLGILIYLVNMENLETHREKAHFVCLRVCIVETRRPGLARHIHLRS